jgi:hypothetical protein
MLNGSQFDQGRDGVVRSWYLVAIYDDANGKGDKKDNEGCRLVPAKTYGYSGANAGLNVSVGDQVEYKCNGE